MNKGILCKKHNSDLAPLADVLADQLRFLNAQLGVRPDHNKKTPHASVVTDSDGREYQLSVDTFRVKGGHLLSEKPLVDGRASVTMEFGTQDDVDRWIEAQKEAGNEVELIERVESAHLSPNRFRAQIKLGGADGLRAVGYVALTFLAHKFPDIARSASLEPFRTFVLEEEHENDFVWWLDPPAANPADPYPFGHKIEIAVPASGEAVARVTFFSCIAFGIRFGSVTNDKDETVTTYIDPLALHPPDDVIEQKSNGADMGLKRPASQAETLRRATSTRTAERSFDAFMRRVTDYRLQEDMRPLHARLLETRSLPTVDRRTVVDRMVEDHAQRVLNLIHYVARDVRDRSDMNTPAGRLILTYLDATFPEGKKPSHTFQAASENIQAAARKTLADTIYIELETGHLDLDRLAMLFGGGPGAAIAFGAVMKVMTE